MNKIICYTAIFGDYDELLNPVYADRLMNEATFICFTDRNDLQSDFWTIIYVERKYLDPTRENRYYKLNAYEVLPEHDISLYIDGNIFLKSDSINEIINQIFSFGAEMAIVKHPKRDCLFVEGETCIKFGKDRYDIIVNQLSKYKLQKFPHHFGLWACSIIFRKNTSAVENLCQKWWEEVQSGSRRDQISFPYVLNKLNFKGLLTLDWKWEENDFYKRAFHKKIIFDKPILNLNTEGEIYLPKRILEPLGWAGHIPFAIWLVWNYKPNLIVELGTHTGNSFFSFCQAMQTGNPLGKVYAIDLGQGGKHSGYYSDGINDDLYAYQRINYPTIGSIIRKNFNEAINDFEDQSVDLLHIDGLHTYEAVKNDFETWLPKLKTNSIVLFHDISVFREDFGVNQFWNEVINKYPINFSFHHSNGLGVLSLHDTGKGAEIIKELNNNLNIIQLFVSTGEALSQLSPIYFENLRLKEKINNSKAINISEKIKKIIRFFK
ncbi:class I SAM-dependent methyltransferase [Algoriphagus hitonicola]|uniref:TOD1/MUCI70 glycosyltransferase-like domain-containing protein n=1 Tax=Algoriphagus hitonicola TaxID=435880 RepID=A0A1I2TKG5_9BACT|nr:class I SAM-dependent methyltransferase [Algoriphagus hitonicola]SFG63877.1 Protein of unknown function [Algoriphagus hitonicola]